MEGATAHDFHNPQRISHERSACRPFSARPRMAASQSGRTPASPPLRTAEHLAARLALRPVLPHVHQRLTSPRHPVSTASTSPSSTRNPRELHGRAFREGSERRSLTTTYCPTAIPEGAPMSILRSRAAPPRSLPWHPEHRPRPALRPRRGPARAARRGSHRPRRRHQADAPQDRRVPRRVDLRVLAA
jgi:hypothetical protein